MNDAQARRAGLGSTVMSERGTLTTQPTSARSSPADAGLPPSCTADRGGADEIVRQWLDRKDELGQAQFTWHLARCYLRGRRHPG